MKQHSIHDIFTHFEKHLNQPVLVAGWLRSFRDQKKFFFLQLYDGSCFNTLQVIADPSLPNWERLYPELNTGASLEIEGILVKSPAKGQSVELQAKKITLIGTCPSEEYPLQKKRHSFEFLRTIAHLRGRTNTQGAVARVRSHIAGATHQYFQQEGFFFLPTPILTASDCEGSGAMFRVTTLDPEKKQKDEEDFFKRPAFLTVSGQLNAESYACAISKVYTFGPTFRAENSHTSRHLAEFWMIEPEEAFCDIHKAMKLAESYLKFVVKHLMKHCKEDLVFFDQFIEKGLLERLEQASSTPFAKVSYTEAIELLEKSKKDFEFPVKWGIDLQSEHERYLAEEHYKKPVFITDYPEEIKAFYMKLNSDKKTVSAFDLIVPKIGELIGGSQREERLSVLEEKLKKNHLNPDDYTWYLELRKYGTVPHSGFGVGFERMIQFFTGVENIRDVHPFPRYPGHISF